MNKKKGFTLIELIVVIAIIAVLMMILVPTMTGIASSAKKEANLANAKSIYTAVMAQNTAEASGLTPSSGSEKKYAKIEITGTEGKGTLDCKATYTDTDDSKSYPYIHADFYDVSTIPANTCTIKFDKGKISVVYGTDDATKATYPQQ